MQSSRTVGRRRFLSLLGAGAVASAGLATPAAGALSTTAGADLTGWETVVGDAVYAAAGQAPVTAADIATENRGSYTRLRANVAHRGVMAHVLAYRRLTGPSMMTVAHRAGLRFRLPYLPTRAGGPLNAQTVEGGLFVWDGRNTRVDHGTAFQWVLNPWQADFGRLSVWTGTAWRAAGRLRPDTAWHTMAVGVDPVRGAVDLRIDGNRLPAPYSRSPKAGWGTDVSARLQAEAVSLWPGADATWAPEHRVLIRDWTWQRR